VSKPSVCQLTHDSAPVLLTPLPANAIALIVMSHAHANAEGNVLGLNPPPMLITTTEGDRVRAEVISIAMDNYNGRFHMRIQIRGAAAESDADALLSLHEESKKIVTNAKRNMERHGLYKPS
jgi:hypothetical protein